MRLSEILHLVWLNIMQNRFKMALTSLGIIVGAATIVMVIAIGRGGQLDVEDQFRNLAAGSVEISYNADSSRSNRTSGSGGGASPPGMSAGSFGGGSTGRSGGTISIMQAMPSNLRVSLSEEDVSDLALFIPAIDSVSLYASGSTTITGGEIEEDQTVTVVGTLADYAGITNLKLAVGDFITDYDQENRAKVVVLGAGIAGEMFDTALDAFDSTVVIDGRIYTVCGVLKSMGQVVSGISPDDAIYIPFSTAKKYVLGSQVSPKITAVAASVSDVPQIIEDATTVLGQTYPGAVFTIADAGEKMEAAAASANTLSLLLTGVASIVFIVGGIGIMNVLFVSVKERTREIGILKAMGTSRTDILLEFLLESNFISIFGGVVGVGLAYAAMPLMSFTGMRMEPTFSGGLMALLFAVVTGTVFGFYPALRASMLVPIEALNQD
jgi:putative ABC transport system permease protein